MGIRLQFYFSPYPSSIWDEGIPLSHASYQLLGYLLKHTDFGRDSIWLTDNEIFNGRYSRTIKDFDKGSGIKSKKGLKYAVDQLTSLGWLEVKKDETDLARIRKIYKLKLNDSTLEDTSDKDTVISRSPSRTGCHSTKVDLRSASGNPPVDLRSASGNLPVDLRSASGNPPVDLRSASGNLVHEDIDLLLTLKDLKIQDPERSQKEYKKEVTEEEFVTGCQPATNLAQNSDCHMQKNEVIDIEAREVTSTNLPAAKQEKDILVRVKHSTLSSQASYTLPANQKTKTPEQPTKTETSLPTSKTPKAPETKPAITNLLSMEDPNSCELEVLMAAKKQDPAAPKTNEWQLFLEAIISVFKIHIQTYNGGKDGYPKLAKQVQGYYQAGLREADIFKLGRYWKQSFMAKNLQAPLLSQFSLLYGQSRDWVEPIPTIASQSMVINGSELNQKSEQPKFLTRSEKNVEAVKGAKVSNLNTYLNGAANKYNLTPEQLQGVMNQFQGVI